MAHAEQHHANLNIVLLGSSPAWLAAVREQARALGIETIHYARTPQEVMTLLAGGSPPVSHLLLQPNSAGNLLPELIDMTVGQPSGVVLVVLGEPALLPDHPSAPSMTFVPTPTHGWLERALSERGHSRAAARGESPSVDELKDALADTRIQTRYQPIVRLDNGQPVGLEVLARLEHPQRGILLPDLFVPQIEAAGLAWPLTQAVITRAFADWGEGKLGSFGLSMALNFPLDVLLIPEALTWLEAHRRVSGLPADRVTIELTESRPVAELTRLRHAISTLRGMGYGLAIDDVGPELRDHQALLDLQFTALKLDKDLVRESPDSPTVNAFLVSTIAAARAANLTIIAEGVEDVEIWRRMQRLGVDQAQGFLVARPLPASAVALWHSDWTSRLKR
jgi:EAL domain-containing protein (putative c-di-GMP-specific phosphodiesterase class I)